MVVGCWDGSVQRWTLQDCKETRDRGGEGLSLRLVSEVPQAHSSAVNAVAWVEPEVGTGVWGTVFDGEDSHRSAAAAGLAVTASDDGNMHAWSLV